MEIPRWVTGIIRIIDTVELQCEVSEVPNPKPRELSHDFRPRRIVCRLDLAMNKQAPEFI
jgi:hypothetical protein